MRRVVIMSSLTFAVGIAFGVLGNQFLNAQQQPIKRTEVLKTDMAGMEGKEAHMWVAEIAPGAATGKHSHPTPRFVYVIAGSVTLEVEGKAPQTFKTGEGFREMPDVVHNFSNASTTNRRKPWGSRSPGRGSRSSIDGGEPALELGGLRAIKATWEVMQDARVGEGVGFQDADSSPLSFGTRFGQLAGQCLV